MRAAHVTLRAFVYGTEEEARVAQAVLFAAGLAAEAIERGRLTRARLKGHHGSQILNLELVLRRRADVARFIGRLAAEPLVADPLRHERRDRLDERRVLHFRLDKQEAVQERVRLGQGGDSIAVEVRYEALARPGPKDFPWDDA